MSDLEAKSLMTDKTTCVSQSIRSVSFDWSQYLMIALPARFHKNNVELDILENNPLLFLVFK